MDGIERIPQVRHPHDVMAENEQLRAQLATAMSELTAENERLRAFVQKIIDLDVPEGDEAAALNALKWAAPRALRQQRRPVESPK